MKKLSRSRDEERFALTTLRNPNLEVRSLCQMIAATQKPVEERTTAPETKPSGEHLTSEDTTANRGLAATMPLVKKNEPLRKIYNVPVPVPATQVSQIFGNFPHLSPEIEAQSTISNPHFFCTYSEQNSHGAPFPRTW